MNQDSLNLGKIPPQNIEVEKAVLSAIMIEKGAINDVAGILSPDSFYKESHGKIYSAILDLHSNNDPIDLLTVVGKIKESSDLENVGGVIYLTELTNIVSSASNLVYHARMMAELSIKRKLIKMASEMLNDAYDDTTDALNLIGEVEKKIIDVNSSFFNSGKSRYVKQILPESIKGIEEASKKPNGVTGVPSGIPSLDKVTGGWQDSDLIIIGARSGMGKSDLAVNLVLGAAKAGFKTALYTLEMSDVQLVNRMIAVDREIERTKIRNGKLNEEDWNRLMKFSNEVSNRVILVDDPGIDYLSIRSSARSLKIKEKIDMVVVDYLQLIESLGGSKTTNDKVSEISRNLKLIAKELKIPVIALSQLSRAVETRGGDKRPIMSDLRDSGSIEQDADIVIFPYRPEYYGFENREDGSSTFQLMEIDIAKFRNGSVETVDSRYLGKFGKITEWVEDHPKYNPDKFTTSGASDFDTTPNF